MHELEQRIDNLEKDKAKAMQLSMKAIAARSNIKSYLDDEKNRNDNLGHKIVMLQQQNAESEEERMEYQRKHDEMFNSVSALNQRIEELESHKLHLLSKLKGYGDKGGLEYIVKTQGLDELESKQFENRVVVEEYDPQARRDAQEAEAQDLIKQETMSKKKKENQSKDSLKSKRSTGRSAAQ